MAGRPQNTDAHSAKAPAHRAHRHDSCSRCLPLRDSSRAPNQRALPRGGLSVAKSERAGMPANDKRTETSPPLDDHWIPLSGGKPRRWVPGRGCGGGRREARSAGRSLAIFKKLAQSCRPDRLLQVKWSYLFIWISAFQRFYIYSLSIRLIKSQFSI